jgi:cell wall assembly regulator SMI1
MKANAQMCHSRALLMRESRHYARSASPLWCVCGAGEKVRGPAVSARLRSALLAFEDRLAREGVPVVANMRPPATDEVLRHLESETGYAVRGEPLTWWQWHDGIRDPEPSVPRSMLRLASLQLGGSAYTPLTIEEALRSWAERIRFARETAEDAEAEGYEFEHADSWFPIGVSEHGSELLIELEVGQSGESAVRVWEWSDPEGQARVRSGSMAEMVELWNDALERGLWRYRPGQGWEKDRQGMTLEERRTRFL